MQYKHWFFMLAALLLGACASTQADKKVKTFRERAPGDRSIRLDLPAGYDPNAAR